ncbi:MAG: AEC family transporter [Rickettsiales bacterium]
MDVFFTLARETSYLFAMMAIGYVSGRWLKIDARSIGALATAVFAPIVFFIAVSQMRMTNEALCVPALVFALSAILCVTTLRISRRYLGEKTPYLAALSAAGANCGYFGIPVAMALFDPERLGIYVLAGFGFTLCENSLGVYFISRGAYTPLESLKNVLKFPATYAIFAGMACSALHIELPQGITGTFYGYFKGAYVVAGMMVIGLGVSETNKFATDWPYICTVAVAKFVASPLIAVAFVWADRHYFHLLGDDFYRPLLLVSIMPLGVNSIAFAMKYNMRPEKAATACLLTTLAALVYLPLMVKMLEIAPR